MIRPEAKAQLARWRPLLIGAAATLVGLWWISTALGPLRWVGLVGPVIGAALIPYGIRRLRMRMGAEGPGLVEIDERQITFLGPYGGGAVSLNALARVSLRGGDPAFWVFEEDGGQTLAIPASASGADRLFDAITALPGIDMAAALDTLGRGAGHDRVIWQKSRRRLH